LVLGYALAVAVGPVPEGVAATRQILCLGDSLTEGYGVAKEAAYPALMEADLRSRGYKDLNVVNAGISGSTSASGAGRLKWHLKAGVVPTVLLLALGGNDGLRGVDLAAVRKNLTATIDLAKESGIKHILVAGMKMPPNYGKDYTDGYAKLFGEVAKAEGVDLLPFLLVGVAGEHGLNQADGIHPNEAGHKIVAKTVADAVAAELGPAP
jgi:acyl-CoA thioesterase-1